MTLGALIDAGLPLQSLKKELDRLPVGDYKLTAKKVTKKGIQATKVDIESAPKGKMRSFKDLHKLISQSKLDKKIKGDATRILTCLAQAEAKVHQTTLENVHFHEIGALDSIVDIVGTAIGLNLLNIEAVYASVLPLSQPAPATLEILKGFSISNRDTAIESVTPTGAAIIKALAKQHPEVPPMKITTIGYGAGSFDTESPNVLRLLIGESSSIPLPASSIDPEEVLLIETNIDDLSGEMLGYVPEKLFEAGALDVWFVPIYMKKNRPAVTLKTLTMPEKEEAVTKAIFKETGTLGLRVQAVKRVKLDREVITVKTQFGQAKVKIGKLGQEIVNVSAEYEDCARLAKKSGRSLREIYHEVVKSYQRSKPRN